MNDLTIVTGSIIIILSSSELITLLNLMPPDITDDNFIFSSELNAHRVSTDVASIGVFLTVIGVVMLVLIYFCIVSIVKVKSSLKGAHVDEISSMLVIYPHKEKRDKLCLQSTQLEVEKHLDTDYHSNESSHDNMKSCYDMIWGHNAVTVIAGLETIQRHHHQQQLKQSSIRPSICFKIIALTANPTLEIREAAFLVLEIFQLENMKPECFELLKEILTTITFEDTYQTLYKLKQRLVQHQDHQQINECIGEPLPDNSDGIDSSSSGSSSRANISSSPSPSSSSSKSSNDSTSSHDYDEVSGDSELNSQSLSDDDD